MNTKKKETYRICVQRVETIFIELDAVNRAAAERRAKRIVSDGLEGPYEGETFTDSVEVI